MRARRKRLVLSMSLLLCLLLGCLYVTAADERLGQTVDGSVLTDNTEAETTVYSVKRGTFFSHGTCAICDDGGRKVTVSGNTSAYENVDKITVGLIVQRLVDGNWVYYKDGGINSKKNAHFVSHSKQVSVEGGYYYRGKANHEAVLDGVSEGIPSYTDGIWIP